MTTPSSPSRKTDLQLQQDVMTELGWDTRVYPASVGVEVMHGIVTLSGTTDCWAKKHAAEQAAHRVAGVRDVANSIVVRPSWTSGATDAEIAEAVRAALVADQMVPDERISTTVDDGFVTLEGTVDYASQREDAARAIQGLANLRGVFNHIVVDPPVLVQPAELRMALEGAIARHAVRAADQVKIDIEGARVTLSGVVDSLGERIAIVGAARGTRGVGSVEDRLSVA